MSQVTTAQVSFNGGEISRRLHARIDQGIRDIALGEMVGFAPLVEGPMEAMPGTYHVAQAPGPCRLIRFEFNTTQGHVLEFSDGLVRVYTNDDLLLDEADAPVEIASPYSFAEVKALNTHASYDVLYCCTGTQQPREFWRDGPDSFGFDLLELEDGPFDPRNKDEGLTVSADAVTGNVTLTASSGIFAETDVGSLFRMEAGDFGDITAWEPGVTVTQGQLLTWNERVYRVVGGGTAMRTGSLQPLHTEGVEWDGIGKGQDINENDAAGVQLEYVHDRIGLLKITGFISATQVTATVQRRLPFSAVGNYDYDGSYVPGEGWIDYNAGGVTYSYGTWRWSFGAFSDTRGWPVAACIWNERLVLAKGQTVYLSVAGDFKNFATRNELGEISNDMAIIATIADPNPIRQLVADEKLLILNASGVFSLGPSNAASGVGPGNVRLDRQNNSGSAAAMPAILDSRVIYIGRSGTRIHETEFDAARGVEDASDLTRYARHIARAGLVELAPQQEPFNFLWAVRNDGALICGAYLPQEQVLGWCRREMAAGVAARSICAITDPTGTYDQIWLAVEFGGGWHVLRMAAWREDGESDETGCMLDMALDYEGAPKADFALAHLPGRTVEVVADGRWQSDIEADGAGAFTLAEPASRAVAGLPFPAYAEGLAFEAGGDNGPAMGKKGRIMRAWVRVAEARGLRFGSPALADASERMDHIEQLMGDSVTDEGFGPDNGMRFVERAGAHTRTPKLRVERVAPVQATVMAWGCELEVAQR